MNIAPSPNYQVCYATVEIASAITIASFASIFASSIFLQHIGEHSKIICSCRIIVVFFFYPLSKYVKKDRFKSVYRYIVFIVVQ